VLGLAHILASSILFFEVKIMPTLTVVFQVSDEKAFAEQQELLDHKFGHNEGGWYVSAMSPGDDIRRLELIEGALNGEEYLIPSLIELDSVSSDLRLDDVRE